MDYNNLIVAVENRIAIITINRPEKLNALNHETFSELSEVITNLKNDKNVYVIILTGVGGKAFVAGADIVELHKNNAAQGKEFSEFGQAVFNQIENVGKPVIAAVNGFALGGGCELALACHIRLASENAKFGQPEVNLGIIPGYGGTQRLTKLVGTGKAFEFILTGNLYSAEEAMKIGLVNSVFPPEELLEKAKEMANTIASKGQYAVRASIEAILKSREINTYDGLSYESNLFGLCCDTDDFKEGTKAFLEKRKPNFDNS
ncbi:MAG: enoyl-CoA hydratase/isomerase family protein [Melioribacteraceae bacterium]|nr:enoyl-CoA hydratase/isomerase family protein [Melioribacteraceae bacterium]MCF8412759.1 enoyl-CoA hydratase/isomerase family protein [Melioribacteraceae bacterium]